MKRSAASIGAAATLLAVAALLATAGCLNPMPEELPSNDGDPPLFSPRPNETDPEPTAPGAPIDSDDGPDSEPLPDTAPPVEGNGPVSSGGAGAEDAGTPDAGASLSTGIDDGPLPETEAGGPSD